MSVELDPVELGFRRPFTQEVAETLRLRNPNKDPIVFKVKTTAPKQYCVRPNSGRIDGGEKVEVQVLLQAMKEDPPLDAKCRDKFLVQSLSIAADQDTTSVSDIWAEASQKVKAGQIQEKKIRVSFLPAAGTPAQHLVSSSQDTPSRGPGGAQEEPPAYSSPMPSSGQPSSTPATNSSADNNTTVANVQSSVAAAAASVTNALPTSSEELKAQLGEAQATISRLTKQIQEQGLRQRKTAASSSDSKDESVASQATMAVQQAPGGVAVPVVAAMCLLSFLLAYLFF